MNITKIERIKAKIEKLKELFYFSTNEKEKLDLYKEIQSNILVLESSLTKKIPNNKKEPRKKINCSRRIGKK